MQATAIAGNIALSPAELRVLGCLLEKQRTTPDANPLSLNALRLACNQSTNRDPVVDYDERAVRDALHRLERRGLTRLASGAGSRAPKYRHLLSERLPFDGAEQAVMTVLMLRGTQTPGELKQRGERMHAFADLAEVQATLERLVERGLARRLERRPGQKEERYAQLLGDADGERSGAGDATPNGAPDVPLGGPVPVQPATVAGGGAGASAGASTLQALEQRVARLEREVAELRAPREPA